jgi:polysaccharide deacetylase 2 family uncharacterized protein YibQ
LVLALGGGYLWRMGKRDTGKPFSSPPPNEKMVANKSGLPAKPEAGPLLPNGRPELPLVAIVIDDLGYQRQTTQDFIALNIPLTLSFLPQAPHSREMARYAIEEGKEILLHLPMEPKGFPKSDPGPSALLTTMTDEEIRQILERDLVEFPKVRGINNHMGSLFTEDREKMVIVLKIIRQKNLYFFDSRTSPDSVALSVAAQLGVRAIGRDIFLDNVSKEEAIRLQLEKLIHLAQNRGMAVGCAHPHPQTLRVLKEAIPELRDKVHLVPLSGLL